MIFRFFQNRSVYISALFFYAPEIWGVSATWVGSTSDLQDSNNWSPTTVPNQIATFDATASSFTPTANTPFSIENLHFLNSASLFTFTFDPSLNITGSGITGLTLNPIINIVNNGALTTPQLFFGSSPIFLGSSVITISNNVGGVISSVSRAAQVIIPGNTSVIALDDAHFSVINSESISASSEAGQLIMHGNLGASSFAVGNRAKFDFTNNFDIGIGDVGSQFGINPSGTQSTFTALDDASFNFTNTGAIYGRDQSCQLTIGRNSGIGLFTVGDAATFTFINRSAIAQTFAFGTHRAASQFGIFNTLNSIDFVAGDHATFMFSNSGPITGESDLGQMLIFAKNSDFSVGHSASFTFENEYPIIGLNWGVQMGVRDGAFHALNNADFSFLNTQRLEAGSRVSGQLVLLQCDFEVLDNSSFVFDNQSDITGIGVGQLLIDSGNALRSVSFHAGNYANFDFKNTGDMTLGTDVGQMTLYSFRGTNDVLIGNNATFTFNNESLISADFFSGQLLITDGGVNASISFTVLDNSVFEFRNTGTLRSDLGSSGQMNVDSGNSALIDVDIGNGATFNFYNDGTISAREASAQLVFNELSLPSSSFTLGNQANLMFTNDALGVIQSNFASAGQILMNVSVPTAVFSSGDATVLELKNFGSISSANNAGQIVMNGSAGDLSVTFGNQSAITTTNSGQISSNGISAQIVVDGLSALSPFDPGTNSIITATNTSGGTIVSTNPMFPAAQMYFLDTVISGSPILHIINQQAIPNIEGIVFDGASSANNSDIILENTSLLVKTTSPLNIASLTGDDLSLVKLDTNGLTITTLITTDTTFSGLFSGINDIIVGGPGIQALSGVNMTGMVTKNDTGTLTFFDSNTFPGQLVMNAGLVDVTSGATFGTGDIIFDGGTLALHSTMIINRDIHIQGGGGTLDVAPNTLVTLSGPIGNVGGGPFTKNGSGSLNITGSATYDGTATINGGTLYLNTLSPGFPGNIVIESGATLKGTGVITGTTVIKNGGVGSAGNDSIGTLTTGDYTFNSGSTYAVEIDPLNGTLTVASGVLTINPNTFVTVTEDPGVYNPYHQYRILSALTANQLTDLFAGVSSPFPLILYDLIQYPLIDPPPLPPPYNNNIYLGRTVLPFSSAVCSLDGNAEAVAHYLDNSPQVPGNNDFYQILQILSLTPSCEQLNEELLQLQPSHLKGLALVQENNSMLVNQSVSLRAQSLYRSTCIRDLERGCWNLWGDVWGDFLHQHSYHNEHGFHAKTGGAVVGGDCAVTQNFSIGVGTGYSYSDVEWESSVGSGSVQGFYGLLYGSWFNSNFFANGTLMGAYNHYTEKRSIHLSTPAHGGYQIHRHASAHFNGGEGGVSLNTGAFFNAGGVDISPFAGAEYYYLHQDEFKEFGADSINLKVKSSNADLLRASLGLNIAKCFVWPNVKWIPSIQVAVVREERFVSSKYRATMQANNSLYFTVYGMKPCRTLVAPQVGFTTWIHQDRCAFSLFYTGQFNNKYQDQQVNLQLSYKL